MAKTGLTVGFVGLGRMGAPMASRLLDAGFDVAGFDPAPGAGADLGDQGGRRVSELAQVAVGADVVILMLPNSDVVESVVDELQAGDALVRNLLLVDMSSSEPVRTRELAERLLVNGVTLVDAPVSGGVAGAQRGSLTIMAGGPSWAFERARPLLDAMGSKVTLVGDVGSGHAVKALNNLMSATHLLVSSEALMVAEAFGLDLEVVLEVVNGSSGRSGSTEVKWPRFVLPGSYDSGFAMALMVKDMRIARALADGVGVPMQLGDHALGMWEDAERDLPPGADHTEIARWLRTTQHLETARESDGGHL